MRVLIVFANFYEPELRQQMDRAREICRIYAAAGHVPICLGLMELLPRTAPCVHSEGAVHSDDAILENWNQRLVESGAIDMIVSDDSIHSGYELRLDILASEQGIPHFRFDPRALVHMGLGSLCPLHALREEELCAST